MKTLPSLPALVGRCVLVAALAANFVVTACDGRALDVGEVRDAMADDGGVAPNNAGPIDVEDSAAIPVGLTVDGIPCTSTESGFAEGWPAWKILINGDCGALGRVHAIIDSNASLAYPQSCGSQTTIQFGADNEGDAATLYFVADATRGTCTLEDGPKTNATTLPVLLFKSNVIHVRNSALIHQVLYRGQSAAVIVSGGDGSVDSSPRPEIDADVGDSDAGDMADD